MMKSLYSGVAGLKVHNQRMDVIGNNISNVNTTGYKASAVTFKDIFYQNKSYASTGDLTSGGRNPNQVGYGAQLNSIGQIMTQSGLTYSDSVTDCAIQGEGFFQVMDEAGNIYYTRNGNFHIDNIGNLCDASGNIVLGVSGDPTGIAAGSDRINLYVPPIDNNKASVEKVYKDGDTEYTYTITANNYGDSGNFSFTIIDIDDDETPFATQNDRIVTIRIDLDQDFLLPGETDPANPDRMDLASAVNAAIVAGGVELPGGVLPLDFHFDNLPIGEDGNYDIEAKAATNILNVYPFDAAGGGLTFTAAPGAFGNKYEIDVVAYKPGGTNNGVSATWRNNVLTIRVPDNDTSDAAAIQAAIDAAAGGDPKKAITVTGTITDTIAGAMNKDADGNELASNKVYRVGLAGGKDNFFKSIAETMETVKLTGGSYAADQTTRDLETIFIDDDGVIYGVHAVHGTIAMGRIDIAVFENPEGLDQVGNTYWQPSLSSGDPDIKKPGDVGAGSIVSTALEMSNADLSQEISDMIITQRGFQANSRVITVTDTMLEELVNLKR